MNGQESQPIPANGEEELGAPFDRVVRTFLGRRVRDLRVTIRNGGLVLRGCANSYHAKQLAQHAAMVTTTLPLTANEIEVCGSQCRGHKHAKLDFGPRDKRVLLASGDDRLRTVGHEHLADNGYKVATASGGVDCLDLIRRFEPSVLILDAELRWGGADGVLAQLRAGNSPRTQVVLLSSCSDSSLGYVPYAEPPVVAIIEKPIAVERLLNAVAHAAESGAVATPGS